MGDMKKKSIFHFSQVVFKFLAKTSANNYAPTIINTNYDCCETFRNNQSTQAVINFFSIFYPPAQEQFGHLIHPCPYTVSYLL
jgi:hypothetical protein